jgi:long-subunit fatty acid transport protein
MKNLLLSTLLLILFSSNATCQNEIQTRDLESWSTVSANKQITKVFGLNLEQSVRMYDNSTKIDQYFTNLDLNFKVGKGFSLTGGFRFIGDRDKDDGSYENHLRFNGDINYKHSVDRFKFKYRIRLQTKNELAYSREEGDFLRNSFRIRAGVKYNIKGWKLDPEMSYELFRESGKYMVSSFNKYRISLSTKYKFNKLIELKAFYRYERGLGSLLPQSTNIVGFNLMFNL